MNEKVIIKTIIKNKIPKGIKTFLSDRISHILDLNTQFYKKVGTLNEMKNFIKSISVSAIEYILMQNFNEVESVSENFSDFDTELKRKEAEINDKLTSKYNDYYLAKKKIIEEEYNEKNKKLEEKYKQMLETLETERESYENKRKEIEEKVYNEFSLEIKSLRDRNNFYEKQNKELALHIEDFEKLFKGQLDDAYELAELKRKIKNNFFLRLLIRLN